MKKILVGLFLSMFVGAATANEIYITQIGDSLDLDIEQTGDGNTMGTITQDVVLDGNDMTFAITQTGDGNSIAAIIKGATYTGTWDFTGDNNDIDLLCSSLDTATCDTVTMTITVNGNDNTFDFDIGETKDASGTQVVFTIDGDDNVIESTIDGTDAYVKVVMDDTGTFAAGGVTNDHTGSIGNTALAASNSGSIVDIDVDGDGLTGHTVDLNITGGGNVFNITQDSSLTDQSIIGTFEGDGQTVDIKQSN